MNLSCATLAVLLFPCCLLPAGESRTFLAPRRIPTPPAPRSVTAGDFNGDGWLDLATVHGEGVITVLIQGRETPARGRDWLPSYLRPSSGIASARAADIDGDGLDDLLVADSAQFPYFLRSRGDGTFEAPELMGKAVRMAAYDLAVLDYNGDGVSDLLVDIGSALRILRGKGDGTFDSEKLVESQGWFWSPLVADFDLDGFEDFASAGSLPGFSGLYVFIWISRGDGAFTRIPPVPVPCRQIIAITGGDFNGDWNPDLLLAVEEKLGEYRLLSFLGNGDGTFLPLDSQRTGLLSELLVRDLDRDGRLDLVLAGEQDLFVSWGEGMERFELGSPVEGLDSASGIALGDVDGNGSADLFVPRIRDREIQAYLDVNLTGALLPTGEIQASRALSSPEMADLDGDGVPDLLGAVQPGKGIQIAFLDASGGLRGEATLPTAGIARALAAGRIDNDDLVDLAALYFTPRIAIFTGRGGGALAEAGTIATIEDARGLLLGDVDSDGFPDLVVHSMNAVSIHHGRGGGLFQEPVQVAGGELEGISAVALADLDGDSRPDLLVADETIGHLLLLRGRGGRELGPPEWILVTGSPRSLALGDLNRDGLPDISAANAARHTATVLFNRGDATFTGPEDYLLGFEPRGHRLSDLDGDGILDLVAFGPANVIVLPGVFPRLPDAGFRRGDVNIDGEMDLSDVIEILNRLFLRGPPLPCEDAADSNDDGALDLSDAIYLLDRLFTGGKPLPPPGPELCGPDPTPDGLAECPADC